MMDRSFPLAIPSPNNYFISKRWKHIMGEQFFSKASYVYQEYIVN
jgi:hypothetical protein